jgi:hypothetical protein
VILPDHDAVELADLLTWISEFFAHADHHTHHQFTAWATNPNAVTDLTNDLNRWNQQLLSTLSP